MDRKEEFQLQLLDRVSVFSDNFHTHILEFDLDNQEEFMNDEVAKKIESISNDLGDLYQMIGNVRFK